MRARLLLLPLLVPLPVTATARLLPLLLLPPLLSSSLSPAAPPASTLSGQSTAPLWPSPCSPLRSGAGAGGDDAKRRSVAAEMAAPSAVFVGVEVDAGEDDDDASSSIGCCT